LSSLLNKFFDCEFAMSQPSHPTPSRLVARIAAYAAADFFGLFCLFVGISGLLGKPSMMVDDFPRSTAEAYVAAAGGLLVMLWAMSRILHEVRQLRNMSAGKNR
jgi:hypothetical protein